MKKPSFTLIELVMVIVILAILAVAVISYYSDLRLRAKKATEKAIAGAIKEGIQHYFVQNNRHPTHLDNTSGAVPCVLATPCFDTVLSQGGITDNSWGTLGNDQYFYRYAGSIIVLGDIYLYNSTDGSFAKGTND